jgi:protein-tyrosine sulfotransferase
MPGPFSPIFIVGVPRSGTTLLRVLLDSHSAILALPETPWISGAYGGPLSLRQLLLDLAEGPYGVARNVAGIGPEHVLRAGASFLEQLFEPALKARDKSVLAFKTPSDIPHLEFLTALLPDARYIHITRDGRDVALSQLSKKGSFFLDLRGYRSLSYANVFQRWVEWEQKARSVLYRGGLHVFHLRYEDLIADPAGEMNRVMVFLGLNFEQRMLDYAAQSHDYPKWEAGSTDVAQRQSVSNRSVGKWRKEKRSIEVIHTLARHDEFLVSLGYPSSELGSGLGQRLAVTGYAVVRPVRETLSLIARRVRPLVRNRSRAFACLCLLLLAILLLAPVQFLNRIGMTSDVLGPLLCFGATFSFTAAFMPALQRYGGAASGFFRAGMLMLAYVTGLEVVQLLTPDRHPALKPFLFCLSAILVALIAVMPLVLRMRQRARTA